jgi:SOS-response transcriptional repressor LexA
MVISACQTPDGITLKKLPLDEEKKRILLKPLNQENDVIALEEYELETFRIIGEMALVFCWCKELLTLINIDNKLI